MEFQEMMKHKLNTIQDGSNDLVSVQHTNLLPDLMKPQYLDSDPDANHLSRDSIKVQNEET